MKLNRKLSQLCWLEVKHYVLDDTTGSKTIVHKRSELTSTSEAS